MSKDIVLLKKIIKDFQTRIETVERKLEEKSTKNDEESTCEKANKSSNLFIYSGPEGYKEYMKTTFREKLEENFSDCKTIQSLR
jgi:glycosylphosphatidylinositol transamidase (GPIT) subunit GPI8